LGVLVLILPYSAYFNDYIFVTYLTEYRIDILQGIILDEERRKRIIEKSKYKYKLENAPRLLDFAKKCMLEVEAREAREAEALQKCISSKEE
jgi:hypothetical protein